MIRFFSLLWIAAVFALFAGCTRTHGEVKEADIPVASISFLSPSEGAVFIIGDSVNIKATAISTADIHGFDLAIRKADDTTVTHYFTHIHDHNDTLNINEKWRSLVTSPSNLVAEIVLYLDHEGHTKKAKVGFSVR